MGEAALKREFKRQPPREELTSLGALWRDYLWRYVEAKRQDPCVYYTEESPNIKVAIKRACDSRGANGKMFFHQSKVTQAARDELARRLIQRKRNLDLVDDFEDLFGIVRRVGERVPGIGPVTIYDVTSRLAAYKGLEAYYLHYHAGVLEGLKALGIKPTSSHMIHVDALPKPIRGQNADLIESFLCGYRSEIERVMKSKRRKKRRPTRR